MTTAAWVLIAAVVFVDTTLVGLAALGVWALHRQHRRERRRAEAAYVWVLAAVPAPEPEPDELDYLADDYCEFLERTYTWAES